jgi:hypothetical protein
MYVEIESIMVVAMETRQEALAGIARRSFGSWAECTPAISADAHVR